MNPEDATVTHTKHPSPTKKNVQQAGPSTGMRLWMVTLRDPRKHRERKVWVTELIALATSARGAELVARRELPALFAYEPRVHVEALPHHTVKHLTYQAEPRRGE
jgi:hypothetical protein